MATTWSNRGHFYNPHIFPVLVDCRFQVAPDDTGGYGITGLKGQGVSNIYMHTTQTPAAGNPNPASGYILVKLSDNFSQLYSFISAIKSPNSGSDVKIDNSAMTAGVAYVITTLGDASAAKWLAIGVPPGVTPAVGVSFIATSTGGAGNVLTSRVQTAAAAGSGISTIDLIGDPQLSLAPIPVGGSPHVGGWLLLRCLVQGAPAFSGSALGNHAHDLLIKGGQAASTTNDVATYAGPLLGKEQATDATIVGGSASNGGVQNASAGTPAGTVAAPALIIGTPTVGSIIRLAFYMNQSSVQVAGE